MKFKFLSVVVLFFLAEVVYSQAQSPAYIAYINQYSDIAVQQQSEYGIPASITLAQGLLESSAGQSDFAKQSNNHFGIKCKDWTGEKIYHDDDQQGECFRKYDHVLQSYEDHSQFLKNKPRYAFLFQLEPTDYEGWAFGLKKAGYATDPSYAYKLISIIENYGLHQFDLPKNNPTARKADTEKVTSQKKQGSGDGIRTGSMGAVVALVSHQVLKVNGVKFVYSLPSDNYALIADEFNMSVSRLLAYNDLNEDGGLAPGTRVFIAKKKRKAPKECVNHQVVPGESMYSISQDYGVRVVNLYKLNDMAFSQSARIGQVLKLR